MSRDSSIDLDILEEVSNKGLHDMFVLDNNIGNFEKTLDLLKSLCLKMDKYNNSHVLLDENNKILKTDKVWKIVGYEDIMKSVTEIEILINELYSKMEDLDPLISKVDTSKDDIEDYANEIEDVLIAGVDVDKDKIIDNNFNADNIYINKVDVINSINQNFINNREMTNNFNQELYKKVNDEIIKLANDKRTL